MWGVQVPECVLPAKSNSYSLINLLGICLPLPTVMFTMCFDFTKFTLCICHMSLTVILCGFPSKFSTVSNFISYNIRWSWIILNSTKLSVYLCNGMIRLSAAFKPFIMKQTNKQKIRKNSMYVKWYHYQRYLLNRCKISLIINWLNLSRSEQRE